MKEYKALRDFVGKEKIQELQILQPVRSSLRILIELSLCVIFVFTCVNTSSWFLFFCSFILLSSRQHALLVLMHEGAHGLLFNNKGLNDFVGEFLGGLHFMSMLGYRRHHNKHHKVSNINTMEDPDFARKQNSQWVFKMSSLKIVKIFVFDLLGLNSRDFIQEAKDAKNFELENKKQTLFFYTRLVCTLITIGVCFYFSLQSYLLIWVLSILTSLKLILRIRSIADHFGLKNKNELQKTRTIISPWWERILLAPCSIGIHNEHHLFSRIPYYNLRPLHQILLKSSLYKKEANIKKSYLETFYIDLIERVTSKEIEKCDYELFIRKAKDFIGINYSLDFLEKSKTIGVYKEKQLVGGYILNEDLRVRSLDSIPDKINLSNLGVKHKDVAEMTGLWMDPLVRGTQSSFVLWFSMMKNVFFSKKKKIVFAYDQSDEKLKHIYSVVNPRKIYSGPTKKIKGVNIPKDENVVFTYSRMAPVYALLSPFFLIKRVF